MKTLLVLLVATFTLMPLSYGQDDLFRGVDQRTMYIYPSIPIIEGADLMEFHESYSKSRTDQIGEMVQSAETLIKAGAKGPEALEMILAFDKLVTHRRAYSKRRMGVSLEGYFNGRLSELYRIYNPPARKLDFRHVDLPTNILKHANKNMRPGYITEADMAELDFVVYGSYTVARGAGKIHLSLYVINVNNGITRVFNGHGTPQQASYSVAGQLFHEFQKTRFPSILNLRNGKRINILDAYQVRTSGLSSMKNLYRDAKYACEDLGGRLASRRELTSIGQAGTYRGGVTINTRGQQNYYWALVRDDIYISYENRVTKKWSLNSSQYLNYICVE